MREIRSYCPDTLVAVHVDDDDRVGALRDAGAATVVTGQLPPGEVTIRLLELLGPGG